MEQNKLAVVLLLLVGACVSPRPIVQLSPTQPESSWFYGKKVMTQQKDRLYASLMFDRIVDGQVIMAVELVNRSDNTVLVAPEHFFYEGFRADTTSLDRLVYAFNPEIELREINKALSQARADRTNGRIADVVLATAGVALSAALSSPAAVGEGEIYNNAAFSVTFGMSGDSDDVVFLNQLRQEWEQQTLRKTSLAPGQAVRGNVVFDDQPEATFYQVNLLVAERLYAFDYEKEVIRP